MKARWAALALTAVCCFAADTYRVAGVLKDAPSGSPLPRMRMLITRSNSQTVASLVTGQDGRFAFDLPKGTYYLYAIDPASDAGQVFGLPTPLSSAGSTIITGPDQDTANLIFRWFPRSAILGRVLDQYGEPVQSGLVQLIRSSIQAGRRVTTTAGWQWTNDLGEYRFGLLPAGTYYLVATGNPWYASSSTNGVSDPRFAVAYAPAFYPGVAEAARAAPLVTRPGEDARADITLAVVGGATVSVNLNGPADLKGTLGLLTDGVGGADSYQRDISFSRGMTTYSLNGVPAGHYTVRVRGTSGNTDFEALQPVDVSGATVSTEIAARPMASLTGAIRMRDPGGKLPSPLYMTLVADDYSGGVSTAVRPDGTFALPSVAAGKWRPSIRTSSVFASDIQVEGAEFRDGVIDVTDGQAIVMRITASDETGGVRGIVMRNAKPAMGEWVVLAADPSAGDPELSLGFLTDSDGSFDFRNVRAGGYLLFATDDEVEYMNPAVVRRYADGAKRIRIEPHATLTEKIEMTQGAQR